MERAKGNVEFIFDAVHGVIKLWVYGFKKNIG